MRVAGPKTPTPTSERTRENTKSKKGKDGFRAGKWTARSVTVREGGAEAGGGGRVLDPDPAIPPPHSCATLLDTTSAPYSVLFFFFVIVVVAVHTDPGDSQPAELDVCAGKGRSGVDGGRRREGLPEPQGG